MASSLGKQKTADWIISRRFDVALERADVFCLQALLALCDIELDTLVFFQRTVAVGLNGAEVREHVGTSVIGGNEPESLIGVEPFNGSLGHGISLFVLGDRSFDRRNNWSKLPHAAGTKLSQLVHSLAVNGLRRVVG